jgi:hypothetical protein|tara:strand:+ start:3226 stop:3453 length:228 start_codon:yes stop_codon:yes gene_type:complete
MSNTISIENRKDIIRDENSKAILKTDVSEKNAWLKKKERNNKIFQNENEINKIRSEVAEIKNMLIEIKNSLRVIE